MLLTAGAAPAFGGAYCVAAQWGASCDYDDYYDCAHDALARGSVCIADPRAPVEDWETSGASRFCVVRGRSTACLYEDRRACRRAAAAAAAACVMRPE